ncbi:predicted protein [Postia placenta Mad-698-R]|nr:predicted protein [Postia placenta Mad-698-R]
MPHHLLLLTVLCILVFCVSGNGAYAFGAGNIPGFAYLEGKAFRHGDIEDALSEVAKRAGGFALGALIGRGGSKFGGLDIKRVYFGNWLRDYSQAVDVAGLSKLQFQSLGYATEEFEVTPERLGVYLPTEHIDNPKGYPNDAQRYHPKLRGPVDPRELEIDHHTGMKNYIANGALLLYITRSQASVVDLNAELDRARSKSASQSRSGPGSSRSLADLLRSLLFKLPDTDGSGGEMERELEGVERIRAQGYGAPPGSRRPEDMSPQELHAVLWQVLRFRDNVMKKITMVIVFVFTTLEVFNDPRANLILNEPAGHLGKIILIYATTRVVKAWDDPSVNMHHVTDDILHCMFHPDFNTRNSPIQYEMMEYMRSWVQNLGHQQPEVLRRLTKQSVRNHLNMRLGSEGAASTGHGTVAQTAGMEVQNDLLSSVPGLSQASALLGKIGSSGRPSSNHGPGFPGTGMLTAGMGAVKSMPGKSPVRASALPATLPVPGHHEEEERHTSHYNRHGHHSHAHHHPGTEHQHYHQEPQAVPSYHYESHNMTMPSVGGPVAQTSSYSAASAAGYPGASHGYAPPSGPPPSFPNPNAGPQSGYAPAYGYAQPMGGFIEPRDQSSGGYGGRAPPPGPPPSGPAFHGGPPGPPPFPEGRGYPPPGGYGW